MSAAVPQILLNNGVAMPAFGLGVFLAKPEETTRVVCTALQAGYRLIDTAAIYGNEHESGEGIRQSSVARSEIFVTTKVWISDFGYDKTLHAFDRSMKNLGLDFLDLYLIHWPVPADFEATLEAYRAMERLLSEGRVRAIGVSNFTESHLQVLFERREVAPALNQVETHPFFQQKTLRAFHAQHKIVTQAWSPIGGFFRQKDANAGSGCDPLAHPVIVALAQKHAKSPAQIILRWHLQSGTAIIPKSVRAARILENFQIFDFALTADEIAAIDSLDAGLRGGPDPDLLDRQMAPMVIAD